MSFIEVIEPEAAAGELATHYQRYEALFQMVPQLARIQSLRPDLMEATMLLGERLLLSDQALTMVTKQLLAAYVGRLDACEY